MESFIGVSRVEEGFVVTHEEEAGGFDSFNVVFNITVKAIVVVGERVVGVRATNEAILINNFKDTVTLLALGVDSQTVSVNVIRIRNVHVVQDAHLRVLNCFSSNDLEDANLVRGHACSSTWEG